MPSVDDPGEVGRARGLFIVLEGGEGTGKTTQARMLANHLGAVLTHEPGGTSLGTAVRELCLGDRFDPTARAELLLMAADRAQHVAEIIDPALASGRHVVCDRFTYSTMAYQGAGRGLTPEVVRAACDLATNGLIPDAVLVIDVPDAVRAQRLSDRGGSDRLEAAGDAFHRRVGASFIAQASDDPRAVVLDGSGSPEEVFQRVLAGLRTTTASRCPLRRAIDSTS